MVYLIQADRKLVNKTKQTKEIRLVLNAKVENTATLLSLEAS